MIINRLRKLRADELRARDEMIAFFFAHVQAFG
jgi:hypothetical protein